MNYSYQNSLRKGYALVVYETPCIVNWQMTSLWWLIRNYRLHISTNHGASFPLNFHITKKNSILLLDVVWFVYIANYRQHFILCCYWFNSNYWQKTSWKGISYLIQQMAKQWFYYCFYSFMWMSQLLTVFPVGCMKMSINISGSWLYSI